MSRVSVCVVSVCVTQRCFLSLSLSLSLVEIVLMFPLPPFFCRLLAGSMIPEQSRAEQRGAAATAAAAAAH